MIELDGSYLEGGGSIARIALALSTLTHQHFEIENIRKNRPSQVSRTNIYFVSKPWKNYAMLMLREHL